MADFHYELILLDHHLPDSTGLELAQRIRANGCGTPLISLSGSHKACHPSFQGCLEKPLNPPELEKLLQRPPAVDWQVLERFKKFQTGNNQHLIRELVLTFTNSAAERTQALRAAALRGSPHEVKRVAHLLRGAAASVGAVGVAEAGQRPGRLARAAASDSESGLRGGAQPAAVPPVLGGNLCLICFAGNAPWVWTSAAIA